MQKPEPAEEIVAIVNRHNQLTGQSRRQEMRRFGLTHRACYILVRNQLGQLLVQKRTASKDIYPGFWDVAAGGVVLAGESYDQSAQRELAEELGVHCPLSALSDYYYEAGDNRVWGRIYTCRWDGPFYYQPEEVAGGEFMTREEIFRRSSEEPFTPDGVEILHRLGDLERTQAPQQLFLHGLDSSGQGTKGFFFQKHFPAMRCPDFSGDLDNRLDLLRAICHGQRDLTLVGSSFGGLMACRLAIEQPSAIARLILLAPALNFPGYLPPPQALSVPALLIIGNEDTVTPPAQVLPLARASFTDLRIHVASDDHQLHRIFPQLDWVRLLAGDWRQFP